MKVAELKKILDANKITYPKKAKKEDLIQLVKNIIQELNPKKKEVKKVEVIQPYVAPQRDTTHLVSFADRESKKYTEPLPTKSDWETYTTKTGERRVGTVDEGEFERARQRREREDRERLEEIQRAIQRGYTAQEAEEARRSRELALATHPVEASLTGIRGFLTEEEGLRRLEAGIEPPRVKVGTMTPVAIQKRGQDLEDKVLLEQVLVEKKPIPPLPPRPKSKVAFGKTTVPTEPLKPPTPPPSPRRSVAVEDVSQNPKKRPAPSVRKASEPRSEPVRKVTEDDVLRSGLLEAVGAREPSVSRASVRRGSYGRSASHDTQQERLKEIVRQEEVRQESIRRASLSRPDPIVFNDRAIGEFKSDDEPSAPPDVTPEVVSNVLEALKLADAYQVPPPLSRGSSRESSRGRSTPRPSPPPSPRTEPYTNPLVELLPPTSMARSKTPSPKPPPSPKPKTLEQIQQEQEAEHARLLKAQETLREEALANFRFPSETPDRQPTPARVSDYDRILAATLLAQTLPSESQFRPSESVEQFERQEKAQIELADKALAEYEALRLQSPSPARSQSRKSQSRGRFASTREASLEPLREGTAEEESDIPEEQFKFIKEQEKDAPPDAPKVKRRPSVPRPQKREVSASPVRPRQRTLSEDLISKPETELGLQNLRQKFREEEEKAQDYAKERIAEEKKLVDKVLSKPIPKSREGKKALLKEVAEAKEKLEEIQQSKSDKLAETTRRLKEATANLKETTRSSRSSRESVLERPRPKPTVSKFSAPKTDEILKSEIQSLLSLGSQKPASPKPKPKTAKFTYEIPKEVVADKPETKAVKLKSVPKTKTKEKPRNVEEDDDSAYVLPEYSQPPVTTDPKKLKLARKINEKIIEDAKLKAQALFKAKEEAERAKLDAKERKIKEAQAEAEEKEKEQRELKKIRKEAEEEEKKKLEARRKLEAKAEEKRQKIREAEVARVKALEKAKEEIARQKEAVKERRLEPRGASEEPRGATPSRLSERLERSKTPTRPSNQSRPSSLSRTPPTPVHQYGIDPVADLEMDFNRLPRKNIYNVVDKDMNKKQTKTIAEDFRELIAKAKATDDPVVKRGFIMLADAVVNRAYTLSDREGFKQGYNL